MSLSACAWKYVSLCVACLQSFSVICLHPRFISPHCSLALWLSQHEAETHRGGFILELTGECLRSTAEEWQKDREWFCAIKWLFLRNVSFLKLCICAIKFTLIPLLCVCVYLLVWSRAYFLEATAFQKPSPWGIMHEQKASLGAHQFHRLNWRIAGVHVSVCLCHAFFRVPMKLRFFPS